MNKRMASSVSKGLFQNKKHATVLNGGGETEKDTLISSFAREFDLSSNEMKSVISGKLDDNTPYGDTKEENKYELITTAKHDKIVAALDMIKKIYGSVDNASNELEALEV